jgi:hypothetical protein
MHFERILPLLAFRLSLLIVAVMGMPASAMQGKDAVIPDLKAHADWPKARPDDVDTIDHITNAFFAAISAPAGGQLDRQRLRSLFLPSARIELPVPDANGNAADAIFLSPDQYAAMSDAQTAKNGFFDHVVAMQVHQFGSIAQTFVTYESRENPSDKKPFVRGVKAFELFELKGRWYLAMVTWERESPKTPIPDQLLHSAGDSK